MPHLILWCGYLELTAQIASTPSAHNSQRAWQRSGKCLLRGSGVRMMAPQPEQADAARSLVSPKSFPGDGKQYTPGGKLC